MCLGTRARKARGRREPDCGRAAELRRTLSALLRRRTRSRWTGEGYVARLNRQTFVYWFQVSAVGGFWLLGAVVAGFAFSMSLAGRIDGGVLINAFATVYFTIWMATISAFAIAVWTARNLDSRTNLMALARRPQPVDPVAARAWRYSRIAWYGWISSAALLVALLVVANLTRSW